MKEDKEVLACTPKPVKPNCFNSGCVLPSGLTIQILQQAMNDFLDFLGFINQQLRTKDIPRLETFLMPANFSSIVGELGSRHKSGWQGHNPEAVWLLVFYFDSNTSNDRKKGIGPKPFVFRGVYGAKLDKDDWNYSGRSATSRRTITASVNQSGLRKMKTNWIYEDLPK